MVLPRFNPSSNTVTSAAPRNPLVSTFSRLDDPVLACAPPITLVVDEDDPSVRVDVELPPVTTRFLSARPSAADIAVGAKLVAAVGRMRLMFSMPSRFAEFTEVAPLAMVTVSVSVPAPPTTDNVDELEAV